MITIDSVCYRKAAPEDQQAVIDFINDNFDYRLPLINVEDFFQYYYAPLQELQFVLAEKEGIVLSAAGYIRASLAEHPDIWVSVWVAKKGCNGVGLELMNAIPELTGARSVSCNNIREKTCKLYHFLGWTAERVSHYYRLNRELTPVLTKNAQSPLSADGQFSLTEVANDAMLESFGLPKETKIPQKDIWYLSRRYLHYPHKQYKLYAVREQNETLAYLVISKVLPQWENDDSPCPPVLRVVDYVGPEEVLSGLGKAINDLLILERAEYIDCYCYGISSEAFRLAGFSERKQEDASVIIPNYLNTVLQQNTEYYFFTNHPENFVLFKADGDQDRPRIEA